MAIKNHFRPLTVGLEEEDGHKMKGRDSFRENRVDSFPLRNGL